MDSYQVKDVLMKLERSPALQHDPVVAKYLKFATSDLSRLIADLPEKETLPFHVHFLCAIVLRATHLHLPNKEPFDVPCRHQ